MNPKAETVEELLARRKNLHLGMLKLAREDLVLALQAAHTVSVVPSPARPRRRTRPRPPSPCEAV